MLRHHDRECCKLQDWVFRWWFIRNLSSQSLNTINVRFFLGIVTLYPQIEETVGRQNRYCPLHYFRFPTRRVTAELVIHFGSSLPCPWDIGNGPKIAVSNLQGIVCFRKQKTHYSHWQCKCVFRGQGLPKKSTRDLVEAFMLQIRIPLSSWLWLDNLRRRAGSTASISVSYAIIREVGTSVSAGCTIVT